MDQPLPFQRSIRGTVERDPIDALPTATHARLPGHETSNSNVVAVLRGLGTRSIDHRLPSHRSASGAPAPLLLVKCPTAVQRAGDEQDTPDSELSVAAAGLGVGWIDHTGAAPAACALTAEIAADANAVARQDPRTATSQP